MIPERGCGRRLRGVLAGAGERVLRELPQRVLHDLGRRDSESAAIWNRFYARARPHLALADLLRLPRLWGSQVDPIEDSLEPYYWGLNLEGSRLAQLEAALLEVDGSGPATEVDLFLLGATELVLVEAKLNAMPGRCSRYAAGRCPEIHAATGQAGDPPAGTGSMAPAAGQHRRTDAGASDESTQTCRYWEVEAARFSQWLEFAGRPASGMPAPPCDRHYQLGRTLLLGQALAGRLGRRLHLWLLLPERRWPQVQPTWLDFADRVKSPDLWRRMRVLSWEALLALKAGGSPTAAT